MVNVGYLTLHICTSRHRDCVLFSFPKTYKRRPQAAVSTTGNRVLEKLVASQSKNSPHCFGARRSLSVHMSSQMDPIHAFPSCMFKIRFNIMISCTHSHPFGFNPENAVHVFFLHACYFPYPSHSAPFDR